MAISLPFPVEADGTVASGANVTANFKALLDGVNAALNPGAITPTSVAATGTVTGSNLAGTNTGDQTKASLGIGNVDNTSDVNKPVSTAQQTALNLKASLASSPTFTGAVTAPNLPKNREVFCPMDYGAVGDGVTNDGPALNSMFAAVRTALAADVNKSIVVAGGGNLSYRTTISINATGMAPAWNLHIRDLYLIGACPGKAVLDLIATRGYTLDNVSIWGEQANQPAVGFQMQRGSAGGFCDNASIRKIFTDGYFTKACLHEYGMETVHWDHCAFYNRNNTGRVAIFEGYNGPTAMVSDYASVMTGGTSHTNHRFTNCDFRYQPAGANVANITGLTTGANAVVTAPGHAYIVGDQVTFGFVQGLPLLQTAVGTVTAVTTNTVTTNVNTTGWGTYVAGGILVRRQTQASVYVSRCEGFSTESMYVVAYGQPHVELAFPDPGFTRMDNVCFHNILCEGAGINYEVIFTTGSTNVNVLGFTFTTYSTPHIVSLMENNGVGIVSLFSPKIESVQPLFTGSLVGTPARFSAYGAEILYDSLSAVNAAAWAAFNGEVVSVGSGKNTLFVSDTINLFGNRTSFPGSFTQSGTAVPQLGALKPGTSNPPAAWMDIAIDGTTYCFPVWPKT